MTASQRLRQVLPWFNARAHTPFEQIHSKTPSKLNPEKQKKLEELCTQLFKQKELITSGKLQLIGLQQIKRRMGKQWEGLAQIVYETVETVLDQNMDQGDIFIRYKDDSYVMIFAHATPEESRQKTLKIVEEIRQRLFALDEEELRALEIHQAIGQISADMFMQAGFLDGFSDSMDLVFEDLDHDQYEYDQQKILEKLADLDAVEIGTDTPQRKKAETPVNLEDIPEIKISYMPLWDTKKGALTTYLGLAHNPSFADSLLQGHQGLYENMTPAHRNHIDREVLSTIAKELKQMERDGRKFFVVCPVQHATLYDTQAFEEYKNILSEIPMEHRKFLVLFVMNVDDANPPTNAYWFAKPLRVLCPYIFAEIPLRRDINFNYLHNSGANAVGVRLDKYKMDEPETIAILNSLDVKAKALKIDKTFVFDVSSLSITTSAVCAGFDFLGGNAIHGPVERPDSIHRYHHSDLIKELAQNS